MRSLTKLALTVSAAALAITALGAPAAAADTKGTMVFVNGSAGHNVDICIGPKEKSSKLPYGGYYRKNVISTGPILIRFYKSNWRTCKGVLLAKKWFNIQPGDDFTVILTKKTPDKLLIYDNKNKPFLGEIPPYGAPHVNGYGRWINASEVPVNWHLRYYTEAGDSPWAPALVDVWDKSDYYATSLWLSNLWHSVYVTKPEQTDELVSRSMLIKASRRYEVILVGTWYGNLKMVLISRGVSQAS